MCLGHCLCGIGKNQWKGEIKGSGVKGGRGKERELIDGAKNLEAIGGNGIQCIGKEIGLG